MSIPDNIIALLVIFGPASAFAVLGQVTGFVLFFPLAPLWAFAAVWLLSRFATKPKPKPKAPPAKGWFVDKP